VGSRKRAFQLHFQEGARDLGEIVNRLAKETVIRIRRNRLPSDRAKKISELVQAVS